jgi:hypothetical protein
VIDPGETVVLPITLRNAGNASLTAVSGVLSTSVPGVSVTDPASAWPDIAPGLSAPSLADHFALAISPSVACGTPVPAGLQVGHALGQNNRTVPLSVGTTTLATLLDETFTGGIPPTWTVVNGGAGGGAAATWTTADPGFRGIAPPMSSPYAIVDSDKAGGGATQDEQLITPVLDASACQTLELRFNNQFRRYSGAARADVDVSTDGGSSWTNILRMQSVDDGYPNPPNTKTLNLLPHVSGNPGNVKIRFRYWNASFEYWWAIDNVQVSCSASSCTPCAVSGPTPPGEAAVAAPLQVDRSGNDLVLSWGAPGAPCAPTGYAVYRGDLVSLATTGLYGHDSSLACSTTGSLIIPLADARLGDADYFIVAAENGTSEGSYGRASSGAERPASASACRPAQDLGACAP